MTDSRLFITYIKIDTLSAALITVEGAWLDLESRKLIVPPVELLELMRRAPKSSEFSEIERKK